MQNEKLDALATQLGLVLNAEQVMDDGHVRCVRMYHWPKQLGRKHSRGIVALLFNDGTFNLSMTMPADEARLTSAAISLDFSS